MADALDVVEGYLCHNGVSARDLSLESSCPVGPVLVPASEVPNPQRLRLRCILNSEVVQDATTADMILT